MTFCCEHTEKAHELITRAFNEIMGKSDKGPSSGAETFRSFIPYASLYDKTCLHDVINDYESWMKRARSELEKAKHEAEECRCTETEKHKVELEKKDKIVLEEKLQERERIISSEIKSAEFSKNQLEKAEKEKENLEAKISKLEEINQQFNNLRVENQKLENKNQSLEIQIKELKEYKLDISERKLEQLISGLEINEKNKEQLEELNVIYIEKGNNYISVRKVEKDLRKELLKKNKSKNVNEIFKMSKEIAKLEAELAPISQTNKLSSEEKNWTNIHSNFTPILIQQWQNLNFAYEQTQDWINIGLEPTDHEFCAWLRNEKKISAEEVLNHSNLEELKQEYLKQQQYQAYQEVRLHH